MLVRTCCHRSGLCDFVCRGTGRTEKALAICQSCFQDHSAPSKADHRRPRGKFLSTIDLHRAASFKNARTENVFVERAPTSAPIRTRQSNSKGIRSSVMNVETGAEPLGKTEVGFAPTSHAPYLLAGSWRLADFIALMKPRVMALAVFTAMVGMIAAPARIDPLLSIVAVLAIAAGAGASGVLNMWYDADIDVVMARTAMRPIPRGSISRVEALVFGLVLAVGAVVVLAIAINIAAAALLAGTILFYVVVYTAWLKRHTRQNIVIGGAAGALPPVIGWAAVTGEIGFEPLALFLIIFLWTPPHFWALAINRSDDYARAGVPMLPVVAGRDATARQILVYSVLLTVASTVPWALGFAGAIYVAT